MGFKYFIVFFKTIYTLINFKFQYCHEDGCFSATQDPALDEWTSLIIAPVAGGMLFVAMVGLVVFFNMARKKRSQHGTYNPQKQEFMAPRMELNYMLKPPIEERLI